MSVRVAVRFRPHLENDDNESDEIEQNLLIYPQLNCVNVARHFNLYFHDVLPLYSTQDEVFNIVQPLVDDFLQGNNISIITYGPSDTGKTYTMFGNGGTQTTSNNVYKLGLLPRVISYIFDQLQQRFNPMNGQMSNYIYQLQCSFMENYNNKIIDLLNNKNNKNNKKIKFIQKQNGSYDYQNVTKVSITSIADVLRFMYEAFNNRKYVRKNNNRNSISKSHCIVTVKLIFKQKSTNELYKVSMILIDCAAYCKQKNTETNQYINRAFLSLGNVITGIHRSNYTSNNWKDNILTQTLHNLCNNNKNNNNNTKTQSKILLFLNCSLKSYLYEETLATLRFGNLAMTDPMLLNVMDNYRKKIKLLQQNEQLNKSKDEKIKELENKILNYKQEIKEKDLIINELNEELNEKPISNNEQILKLKRKNKLLEERLIKARSEKAKMLPNLLREKTDLKSQLVEMKTTFALYLVKWKFLEKKYIKQIRDYTFDLERYQKKLDNQIKGKRKLGNQMEMLDKIAQDTVKNAIHQRVISSIGDEIDNIHTVHTVHTVDRVQNVIKDLTNKLHIKQTRINDLENKLALFEYSISRTSMTTHNVNQEHPFQVFSKTTTDILPNEKLQLTMIQDSEYNNNNEYKDEEEYMKAFLNKTTLPPTPEKTLSIGFFINQKKNIRISVDVNMTFFDILNELNVKKPKNLSNLQLRIEPNPQPMEPIIVIENEYMNKTLWELILEFGVFSLLNFTVITLPQHNKTLQIQNKNVKKTSKLFKRFKSKKNV